jgi:hypothetical protein
MSKYSASVASLPVPTVAVDAPLFKTLWHYCHQIAIFPWQLFLAWLSWCSTLLLTAVTYIGATPSGFIPNGKVQSVLLLCAGGGTHCTCYIVV